MSEPTIEQMRKTAAETLAALEDCGADATLRSIAAREPYFIYVNARLDGERFLTRHANELRLARDFDGALALLQVCDLLAEDRARSVAKLFPAYLDSTHAQAVALADKIAREGV